MRGIRQGNARGISPFPAVCLHFHAGGARHGAAEARRNCRRNLLRAGGLCLRRAARPPRAATGAGGGGGDGDLAKSVPRGAPHRRRLGDGQRADFGPGPAQLSAAAARVSGGAGGGGYRSGADGGDAAALPRAGGAAGRAGRQFEVRFHGAGGQCPIAGGATDRTRATREGLDRGQYHGRRTSGRRRRGDRGVAPDARRFPDTGATQTGAVRCGGGQAGRGGDPICTAVPA